LQSQTRPAATGIRPQFHAIPEATRLRAGDQQLAGHIQAAQIAARVGSVNPRDGRL
jgi:hypothetical protein